MSLKRKTALSLSIAFSLIFGIMMFFVYISFNDFRRDEFKERFQKRLVFTIGFIQKSTDFEKEAPIFFDENSDNVLLNENILVFDDHKRLIYSTSEEPNTTWDEELLLQLDQKKTIYNEHSTPEVYAVLSNINGENYYIITFAQDITGRSKLDFLKYMLTISYFVSTLLIWFFSYYIVSKFLEPLDILKSDISEISVHKLNIPVVVKNEKDEIGVLASSFNSMTNRLNDVFQSQKDFNSSAAHEMRTPLTRMAFQLENLIQLEKHTPKTLATLQQMLQDVHQLSDITRSLLLLSKFDKEGIATVYEEVRIDEVIFDAFEKVNQNFAAFKMDFQINESNFYETALTIQGIKSLLDISFINLFKNAALYSDNQEVDVSIQESAEDIKVYVYSQGVAVPAAEREKLFDSFMRGSNSQNITGSGLGLRIVKRILEYHNASIDYTSASANDNLFTIIFQK